MPARPESIPPPNQQSEDQQRLLLGLQIKQRREELSYSLRELADEVGLTASFLSQVERGQSSPSIDSLRRISNALGMPIFQLLWDGTARVPLVHQSERRKLVLDEPLITYELLVPDVDLNLEMFIGKIDVHGVNFARRLREPTEECLLVLQGRLQVDLVEASYMLEEGDSIYFEGAALQGLMSLGDEMLVFVSAITPAVF